MKVVATDSFDFHAVARRVPFYHRFVWFAFVFEITPIIPLLFPSLGDILQNPGHTQ